MGVRGVHKRVKADLASHLYHFSGSSFGWLLLYILREVYARAQPRKLLALQQKWDEEGNLNQTQARVFPISLPHITLPVSITFGKINVGVVLLGESGAVR